MAFGDRRIEELGLDKNSVADMLSYYCPYLNNTQYHDEGDNKVVLSTEVKNKKFAMAFGKFINPDEYSFEATQTEYFGKAVPEYFPGFINYLEIIPDKGIVTDQLSQLVLDEDGPRVSFIMMDFLEGFQNADVFLDSYTSAHERVRLEQRMAGLQGYATGFVLGRTGMYTGDPNSGNILLARKPRTVFQEDIMITEQEGIPQSVSEGKLKVSFVDTPHFMKVDEKEVLEIMSGRGCGEIERTYTDEAFNRRELNNEDNLSSWRLNLVKGLEDAVHGILPIK